MQYAFLPILLLVFCSIGLAVGLLVVSGLFNPGRPSRATQMPYESGMDPIHDTHRRFDVRFHLLAIAFLIFDVELLFLYPWAVAVGGMENRAESREQREEWRVRDFPPSALRPPPSPLSPPAGIDAAVAAGWIESRHLVFGGVMTFLLLLTLGFVYDWRKGVFQRH